MAQSQNSQQVAFLRGINVGRAKRVAMADLRKLLGDLGFADVRTVLNSGNLVSDGGGVVVFDAVALLAVALLVMVFVAVWVTVVSAGHFSSLLVSVGVGPVSALARLLALVVDLGADLVRLAGVLPAPWLPEVLVVGPLSACAWFWSGVVVRALVASVGLLVGAGVSLRAWATVGPLYVLLGGGASSGLPFSSWLYTWRPFWGASWSGCRRGACWSRPVARGCGGCRWLGAVLLRFAVCGWG
ncbi:Uncharacterized conserved protein, DUF1697 family [Janthinobacterium sp. 344]|uniref:DUF1697 domain-containing protein n=1 Tax=Janthinobacterium sp. 344 TaxID=1566280 RepID=UPI0008E9F020|nr:DUF1697 domain-containing protein [Janthinobacterium sp. 344]SFB39073.1 Uncharacterized conserved protein, DUF1697 family [Janthinobacterium sp. 344]